MSSAVPDEMNTPRPSFRFLPTIGTIIVILVNAWIIWLFLYSLPSGCIRIAAESGGRQTCALVPGAYIIVGISVVLVVAAVYYLITLVRNRAC
jgi:hypothetical protein